MRFGWRIGALVVAALLTVAPGAHAEFTAAEKAEAKKLATAIDFTVDAALELTKGIVAATTPATRPVLGRVMQSLMRDTVDGALWNLIAAQDLLYDGHPSVSQSGRDTFKAMTRQQRLDAAYSFLDKAYARLQTAKDALVDAEKLSPNTTYVGRVVHVRDQLLPRALVRVGSFNRMLPYLEPRSTNPPNIPAGPIITVVGPHGQWDVAIQNYWRSTSYDMQALGNVLAAYQAGEEGVAGSVYGPLFTHGLRIVWMKMLGQARLGARIEFFSTDSTDRFFAAMENLDGQTRMMPDAYFLWQKAMAKVALPRVDWAARPVFSEMVGEMIQNSSDAWDRLNKDITWFGYTEFPYCTQDFPAGCAGQQR